MNLYEKFKSIQHPLENPFAEMLGSEYDGGMEVRITPHSILNKVVWYATKTLRNPETKWIVLIAHDSAITSAEKCAQILQRNFKGLHQCNSNSYKVVEDIWTPKDPSSDLDSLSVRRNTAVIWIFLAKTELPGKLKNHPERVEFKEMNRQQRKKR